MIFIKDQIASEILKTIGYCGEYYFKSLYLIPGDHNWILRVVSRLEKEGYISNTGKGQLRKLHLLRKGMDALKETDSKLFSQYMLMYDNQYTTGNKNKIWRRLRMSEVYQVMRRAGLCAAFYEKPELNIIEKESSLKDERDKEIMDQKINKAINHKGCKSSCPASKIIQTPLFYSSIEMKDTDISGESKFNGSRMLGALFTQDCVYAVYNLNRGLIKYSPIEENKAHQLINQTSTKNGWIYHERDESGRLKLNAGIYTRCIFFGRNNNVALNLIDSKEPEPTKKEEKKNKPGPKVRKNQSAIYLDSNMITANYIPLNEDGIRLLRIISTHDFWRIITNYFFEEKFRSELYDGIDAYDEETNTNYYLFLDSDLKRLQNYRNALNSNNTAKDHTIVIICYPWQKEIIEALIPQAQISVCELSTIENILRLTPFGCSNE